MNAHVFAKREFDQATTSAASTHAFKTSLWFNAAIFAIELLAFSFLYRNYKSIYESRTFIPAERYVSFLRYRFLRQYY